MKYLLAIALALAPFTSFAAGFSCTELREEPDSPTVGFDLTKTNETYTATFLSYPADESKPPEARVVIEGLSCVNPPEDLLLVECTRSGAAIHSTKLEETTYLGGVKHSHTTYELRAIGSDVPDNIQYYRSNFPRLCVQH